MAFTSIPYDNIAPTRYWGKIDREANIMAMRSLSTTLAHLWTRATNAIRAALKNDRLFLDGRQAGQRSLRKVVRFIEEIRRRCRTEQRCEISAMNSFPAAGLDSTASGAAALMMATGTSGCPLTLEETSSLIRSMLLAEFRTLILAGPGPSARVLEQP